MASTSFQQGFCQDGIRVSSHLNPAEQERDNEDQVSQLWLKSQRAIRASDYATAEMQLTELLKMKPDFSLAYYYRGRVRFQSADIAGSVKDFDQHVKLSPNFKSRQWERGISLYYADQFKQGAQQFEVYQTYHDNDVENSAWRFLCVARHKGTAAARKNLLPIKNDTRVPMMQIYQMFQGKLKPSDVLKAAEELSSEKNKTSARFYANLYVGLLLEVEGKTKESLKHIEAAKKFKIEHYMWDVANIHLQLRTQKKPESDK